MTRLRSGSCLLTIAALLATSASAQGIGSLPAPESPGGRLEALSKKALGGDTKAQLRMGLAFEFGEGVQKDLEQAMRWYHMAADRGDPVAQTDLGYLYETGGGTGSKNPAEAAKWYMRAAVAGLARAKFNLGVLYLEGAGVEKSLEQAAHWISEAADAGCPVAVRALSYLYANGWGVSADPQKALELTRRASKKDDDKLCMSLDHGALTPR